MSGPSILITGAGGLLGRRVVEQAARRYRLFRQYHSAPKDELPGTIFVGDLTDRDHVRTIAETIHPEIIIHCAALADVDRCEREPELSRRLNVEPVRYLTETFPEAVFVQLSTDYVFPGGSPPPEPSAPTRPLNVYGQHKLDAENVARAAAEHLIIRTATLLDYLGRKNVFQPLYEPLHAGREVFCLTDQSSNPLAAADAAGLVLALVDRGARGVFHIGGKELVSRYELAVKLAAYFGFNPELVRPMTSDRVKRDAARPSPAGLDCRATELSLGRAMPTLEETFAVIAKDIDGSR